VGDTKREPGVGLREMTRASVREQIAERSLVLFDENGFDATTVDDIASAIGVSARSFFRYFPSKEDVVIGDLAPLGVAVRDAAAGRPASEPPWQGLRRSFDPLLERTSLADATRGLRTMRVLMSTPALRARNLEKHIAWAKMLEPVITERLDGPEETRQFRARILIHSALACLDVALAEWTRRDGKTPLPLLLDQAFNTLSH
jgi:AcrR family transcriptional regulator